MRTTKLLFFLHLPLPPVQIFQHSDSLSFSLQVLFCYWVNKRTELMALQLSISHQSWAPRNPITCSDPTRCSAAGKRVEFGVNSKSSNGVVTGKKKMMMVMREKVRMRCQVRASIETVGAAESDTLAGKVTEVNKDTFWPIVNGAQDKPVVLDMYTQWCGPCKVMAPKFKELAEKYLDVIFLKLDCNQENKPLAKELGIQVVPTFKILKHGKIVEEITGAKFDHLVTAIETARSS